MHLSVVTFSICNHKLYRCKAIARSHFFLFLSVVWFLIRFYQKQISKALKEKIKQQTTKNNDRIKYEAAENFQVFEVTLFFLLEHQT